MKETVKAGCFLIKPDTREVALIHREKQDDYSFPKGHAEAGEDIVTCALRETAEETKRAAVILNPQAPFAERYVTPRGEACVCYMFIARDDGPSDNTSTDTHEVCWTPFEQVEARLSYPSLQATWRAVQHEIAALLGMH